MKRIYTVRKWIVAESVKEAAKLEKTIPPDEVYLEDFDSRNLKEQLMIKHNLK